MKPTEICFLDEWRVENCRNNVISDPLPKELVSDAWKARVGCSCDNERTHCAYRKVSGMCETLLRALPRKESQTAGTNLNSNGTRLGSEDDISKTETRSKPPPKRGEHWSLYQSCNRRLPWRLAESGKEP
jgi:hypothetical protein